MKKFVITAILAVLFGSGSALLAQDRQEGYLGLPGDNLNLYAVMKLFQESKTLEEFERSLNDEKSNINNLDLNYDNQVDYLKVIDNIDGDVHNIVLQVSVSPRENQDVAVFTVQRFNNGQVQIQLTGDEELYGRDYIIEPRIDDVETPNPGYTGQAVTYYRTTPVEIAAWPIVRFVYLPSYTRWHSSWYWGYYPTYWHAWRPFSYHYYYGYHYNWYNTYYGHYRQWHSHRYDRWNDYYYRNTRAYSPEVSHRIRTGVYKTTYSHPEERRQGEAVFAKSHPEQIRRTGDRNMNNSNNDRRSTDRSINNSNNNRRSSTTVTNRTVVTHPEERNMNTTTRRSSTTVTNRSVSTPSENRSNPSVNRSVSRPEPSNRTMTNSSSPSTNSNVTTKRTVTKRTESTPSVRSNNSNQTRTNSASSSSRRKTESKPATKSESSRKPESNSERRR